MSRRQMRTKIAGAARSVGATTSMSTNGQERSAIDRARQLSSLRQTVVALVVDLLTCCAFGAPDQR